MIIYYKDLNWSIKVKYMLLGEGKLTITVRNIKDNNFYILLGTSYSFYKDSRSSFWGGDLLPHLEQGEFKMAAVCNSNGDIEWFPAEQLKVVDIDGIGVSNILEIPSKQFVEDMPKEYCPACGAVVYENDKVCGACGLTLIVDEDNFPKL